MYQACRFLIVAAMTLFTLSLTASAASAQDIEVAPEVPAGESCGTVELVVHEVVGGCHIEVEGHIAFWVHTPSETPFINCHWFLEARLGRDGEGYVTDAVFTPSSEPPLTVGCTRAPCDEPAPNHTFRPWPVHLVEAAAGNEIVESTFCLRPINADEGTGDTFCEVHLRLTEPVNHQNEVGADDGEHVFCEVNPPPGLPVSITDHLETIGGEAVEIIHHIPPEG